MLRNKIMTCIALDLATIIIYVIDVCVILATAVPHKKTYIAPLTISGILTAGSLIAQTRSTCHMSFTKVGAAILALHVFASMREACYFYSIYMQNKYNNGPITSNRIRTHAQQTCNPTGRGSDRTGRDTDSKGSDRDTKTSTEPRQAA